jgi:predicted DNA-binding transcriptional regulator YafY
MSINKLQFERLNIIHDLLQKGGRYSVDELLEILNSKLSVLNDIESLAIGVSRRTLISDIKYLRSKKAPIPERTRKYFYTESFSFLEVLGTTDVALLEELKGIVGKLQRFNKISHIINVNLDEIALRINDANTKFVLFDNPLENLINADFLPDFLNYIQNQQAVAIKYQDFQNQKFEDILHPYLLKEYNGRWYVFGLSEKNYQETGLKKIIVYAIDRIRAHAGILKPKPLFFENDWWDHEHHFNDIIGVTKKEGQKPQKTIIRIFGSSVDYFQTKKIHHSQTLINEEDDFSDFEFFVIDNYEFRSKILAFGSNAEVLEPGELRNSFRAIVEEMRNRY